MRPNAVAARTGLTRRQQRYIEKKGYLGTVNRAGNGERDFSEPQVCFLESIAALRAGGMPLEEAAAVAAEHVGGVPQVGPDRLEHLAQRSIAEVETSLRKALVLWSVVRRRAAQP